MPKTSTEMEFGIVDVTAKADGTPTTPDKQAFIDLTDLALEGSTPIKAATLEEDFWLLDGTFEDFPEDPENYFWGFWSESMSDAAGVFAVPPVLTITFGGLHTALGLTLTFNPATDDYCNDVNVKWYDGADTVLADLNFAPDVPVYLCSQTVEGFKKVKITFRSTNKPYRFLKLANIAYGLNEDLGPEDIISANILEEVNPTSAEITINTMNFRLHSNSALFNILNPTGVYVALQQRQPIKVREKAPLGTVDMGTFYLENWENDSENTVKMRAIDLIGLMDKKTFRGGMYTGATVASVVDAIAASAGVTYDLDASLASITLTGWIGRSTHREALQQVAFAIGALVDCSRGNQVKIYPPKTAATGDIPYARKIEGGKITMKYLVTGVEVTAHRYNTNTTVAELVNAAFVAGTYEISFNSPAHTLSITGATIVSSGANHAIINVTTPGTVVLTGRGYNDNTQLFGVYATDLLAGTPPNILDVKEATLVNAGNAQAVAQRLFDYYRNRIQLESTILLGDEEPGQVVTVDSMRQQRMQGTIERLETDLTGGFTSKATITGSRLPT